MRTEDLRWSKTRVQCPYCDGWYTRQGILGHIRFRHSDQKKDNERSAINEMWNIAYMNALPMYLKDGRLPADLRERLLDHFLFDYLEKLAKGKKIKVFHI